MIRFIICTSLKVRLVGPSALNHAVEELRSLVQTTQP